MMMDKDFEVIAETVLVMVRAINAAPKRSKLWKVHRVALKILLRGFTYKYFASKLCASPACLEAAIRDGLGDIRKLEPTQLPKSIRKKYHLEHYLPVADLRETLVTMPKPTVAKIAKELTSASIKKVWVLKDEEKKLRQFNRGDPASAYEAAGIEVI